MVSRLHITTFLTQKSETPHVIQERGDYWCHLRAPCTTDGGYVRTQNSEAAMACLPQRLSPTLPLKVFSYYPSLLSFQISHECITLAEDRSSLAIQEDRDIGDRNGGPVRVDNILHVFKSM